MTLDGSATSAALESFGHPLGSSIELHPLRTMARLTETQKHKELTTRASSRTLVDFVPCGFLEAKSATPSLQRRPSLVYHLHEKQSPMWCTYCHLYTRMQWETVDHDLQCWEVHVLHKQILATAFSNAKPQKEKKYETSKCFSVFFFPFVVFFLIPPVPHQTPVGFTRGEMKIPESNFLLPHMLTPPSVDITVRSDPCFGPGCIF